MKSTRGGVASFFESRVLCKVMVRSEGRDFFPVTLANTARDLASSFGFIIQARLFQMIIRSVFAVSCPSSSASLALALT